MKNSNESDNLQSDKKSLYSGVAWYFFSNLFPAFSSLLIFSLASRIITPGDLGAVTLAATITTILTSICAVGFGDALIQLRNVEKKHYNTVFFICLISSLFIYFISSLIVEYYVAPKFNVVFKTVYPVIALKIIIDSCAIVPLSFLTRTMAFKSIAIRTMYCSIASIILCLPVLYFGGGVWAIVLSQLSTSVISYIILATSSNLTLRPIFDKSSFSELSRFGITTTFTKLVTSISIDNVIIGVYGSVTTLGIYAFSRRVFGSIADVLNNAIANVSYPLYASVQTKPSQLKNVFFKTTFFSTLLSLPAFTGLIIISPHLIPLIFGTRWIVAIPVIQVCCVIGFISCIGSLQMSLIKGLGNTAWILKYQIFQQITTALLVFLFARDGALVLILSIAIKTFIIWPYTVYYISRILGVTTFSYISNFIKPFTSVILMYLGCYVIDRELSGANELWNVLSLIFSGVVIYCVFIFILARKEISESLTAIKKSKKPKVENYE
ncbi:lipopolysaccharide biosynthesis protein [Klebsiella variicola]|uniref:lipopolysaccharide biosynthesis protein n=1 Tax=Klebsiella variicola TaxID=244366 RepID=UPI0007CA4A04|nr:lipopolysaccharide biosynthesis protein [Klebsiella variicola]SAS67794.1 Capsule repeat unit export [Klebsiella variicola]